MKKYQIYERINETEWAPDDATTFIMAEKEDDAMRIFLEDMTDNFRAVDAERIEELDGCKCLYPTYKYWNGNDWSVIEFKVEEYGDEYTYNVIGMSMKEFLNEYERCIEKYANFDYYDYILFASDDVKEIRKFCEANHKNSANSCIEIVYSDDGCDYDETDHFLETFAN